MIPALISSQTEKCIMMRAFEPNYRNHGVRGAMLILLVLFMAAGCQKSPEWTQHTDRPGAIYPGELWSKAASPESLGWSSSKLEEARAYAATIDTAAVMIDDGGVDAWGDITRPFHCHSMRKSLMSGLIGIQVDRGSMDLARSIAELGIEDTDPALTFKEKRATVGDLIKARSGIYHPALWKGTR